MFFSGDFALSFLSRSFYQVNPTILFLGEFYGRFLSPGLFGFVYWESREYGFLATLEGRDYGSYTRMLSWKKRRKKKIPMGKNPFSKYFFMDQVWKNYGKSAVLGLGWLLMYALVVDFSRTYGLLLLLLLLL